MMLWVYYATLLLLQLAGLALAVLGLPGLWLMVGTVAVFAWWTGFGGYAGWPVIGTLLALATAAEVVEFVAGAAGSAKAGGSKRGMAGAVVGGLVGAIAFTPLIPIPVVGTIAGACIGSFAGAFLVELGIWRDVGHSTKVGVGAATGRLIGIIVKLCFGAVMLLVAAIACLPI